MHVLALRECVEEDRVPGEISEDGKLDLGIVGADEPHAGGRHEGGADAPAFLFADGDVLEIGILAGQPSGGRAGLHVVRVKPSGLLVHQEGQGVHVGGLQLGELSVGEDPLGNGVLGGEDLQHVHVRGKSGLGLSHRRELAPGEKDLLKLLCGIDIESPPAQGVDLLLQFGER